MLVRFQPQPERLRRLRHYYAVRTLLNWYRGDVDVDARLPELGTFLGHVHVSDTYWYISAVPELLQLAASLNGSTRPILDILPRLRIMAFIGMR